MNQSTSDNQCPPPKPAKKDRPPQAGVRYPRPRPGVLSRLWTRISQGKGNKKSPGLRHRPGL